MRVIAAVEVDHPNPEASWPSVAPAESLAQHRRTPWTGSCAVYQALYFTGSEARCIHRVMSSTLTIRIAPELLARAETRAAQLGVQRARYIRGLIERDLGTELPQPTRQFASEDLAGRFQLGGQSATNSRVRDRLRNRAGR